MSSSIITCTYCKSNSIINSNSIGYGNYFQLDGFSSNILSLNIFDFEHFVLDILTLRNF